MLTFWLRPEFVLRVVSRFQKVAGFDRSIALASSALTATIPLAIIASNLSSQLGGRETAERIIDRYELTGGGAKAVTDVFSPPSGTSTTIGLVGVFFLLIAVLSFTRAVQRLFELTWELEPLSVRNTFNGLLWIGGLTAWIFGSGAIHAALGSGRLDLAPVLVIVPLSGLFLLWSSHVLSAKRIPRDDAVPFAVIGAGLFAAYSVGASVYVPHLFNTYSTRYGVIGAVLAMISVLFAVMFVLVVAAAAGREVSDELARIRRGERPAPRVVSENRGVKACEGSRSRLRIRTNAAVSSGSAAIRRWASRRSGGVGPDAPMSCANQYISHASESRQRHQSRMIPSGEPWPPPKPRVIASASFSDWRNASEIP